MRLLTFVGLVALFAFAGTGRAEEPEDTRTHWVYEGGWFAKTKDGGWYELNELTFRKFGKPVKFKEAKRTKEYVELYDEDRKITVRLYEKSSEVRLADRDENAWEKLYTGGWKTPVAE
jgi:hypothetical protein